MKEIIRLLEERIKQSNSSDDMSTEIGLLIKARTIDILKPIAESEVGFAIEAIGKIASSNIDRREEMTESIKKMNECIERFLCMMEEKNDTRS